MARGSLCQVGGRLFVITTGGAALIVPVLFVGLVRVPAVVAVVVVAPLIVPAVLLSLVMVIVQWLAFPSRSSTSTSVPTDVALIPTEDVALK